MITIIPIPALIPATLANDCVSSLSTMAQRQASGRIVARNICDVFSSRKKKSLSVGCAARPVVVSRLRLLCKAVQLRLCEAVPITQQSTCFRVRLCEHHLRQDLRVVWKHDHHFRSQLRTMLVRFPEKRISYQAVSASQQYSNQLLKKKNRQKSLSRKLSSLHREHSVVTITP